MISVEYFTGSASKAAYDMAEWLKANENAIDNVLDITVKREEPFEWVMTVYYQRSNRGTTYVPTTNSYRQG